MIHQHSRTALLYGEEGLKKLQNARVAVFGVGGVGSYVVEALARSAIGHIDLIDSDIVSVTNINRQLVALHSTIGELKVDVAKAHIHDVCPETEVKTYPVFYLPENHDMFHFEDYDYIVDAIDTITAKIDLIVEANKVNTPIISSMGTGNKTHPELFEISDIYKTSVCPLAKVMRHELKKRNIKKLTVVYSKEVPLPLKMASEEITTKRQTPGSNAFCPATAGLLIASKVINDLLEK